MRISSYICDKCYTGKVETPAKTRRGFKGGFKADLCDKHLKESEGMKLSQSDFVGWVFTDENIE